MHTSIREDLTLMPSVERLLRRNAERAAPSDPRTVASVAVFLASGAAAQINGVAVPVDNGDTAY